ncbi:MAG: hypothetical protein ACON42_04380 [Flavobacteriaceae bacterium]
MKKIVAILLLGMFAVSCGSIRPAQKKPPGKTQQLPPDTGSNKYSAKRNR